MSPLSVLVLARETVAVSSGKGSVELMSLEIRRELNFSNSIQGPDGLRETLELVLRELFHPRRTFQR